MVFNEYFYLEDVLEPLFLMRRVVNTVQQVEGLDYPSFEKGVLCVLRELERQCSINDDKVFYLIAAMAHLNKSIKENTEYNENELEDLLEGFLSEESALTA